MYNVYAAKYHNSAETEENMEGLSANQIETLNNK